MSEIEKMYKNTGVKKYRLLDRGNKLKWVYPKFTAEKQIELIELIANRKGYPDYEYFGNLFDDYIQFLDFNEALAKLVNILWQDLTEQERIEIADILRG